MTIATAYKRRLLRFEDARSRVLEKLAECSASAERAESIQNLWMLAAAVSGGYAVLEAVSAPGGLADISAGGVAALGVAAVSSIGAAVQHIKSEKLREVKLDMLADFNRHVAEHMIVGDLARTTELGGDNAGPAI